MDFNSYFFILFFLPLIVCGYYIVGLSKRNEMIQFFLVVISLFFYSYSQHEALLFIIVSICINYLVNLGIYKKTKVFLLLGILFNVGLLGFYKYIGFGLGIINVLFNTNWSVGEIVAPLGISFISFQNISFLISSYKKNIKNISFLEYATEILFFPHLLQGPILEENNFISQLRDLKFNVSWSNLHIGILSFSFGLVKKIFIADMLGNIVNSVWNDLSQINLLSAIYISFAYTLQIYFDFSGYCDMAWGVAKMINIDLPINFNSPYKSNSIIEFWDRWHITLTNFLTKYIYIPLGGNRKGNIRTYINILIVFCISGIWHGASFTFVIWGILHGMATVFTRKYLNVYNKIPLLVQKIFTFVFINITWVVFRAGSLTQLRNYLSCLKRIELTLDDSIIVYFSDMFSNISITNMNYSLVAWGVLLIGFIIVFCFQNVQQIVAKNRINILSFVLVLIIFIGSIFALSSGTTTYIYLDF